MRDKPALEMDERDENGSTRLTVVGELDLSTVSSFERRLSALRTRDRVVRLDLSKLEFVDGVGLRAVLRAIRDRRVGLSRVEVDPKVSPAVSRLTRLLGWSGLGEGA